MPETGKETPAFQLAVNFPRVDVTAENGPIEIARGTHVLIAAVSGGRASSTGFSGGISDARS
ncbi:hypothetical protein [Sorangium sp. So ce385]|uniref:hypothetical protein n=1 Tax=Sorangium sp. So ce385 TaxID=3133308 RepID=UPI003F5B97CE